MNLGGPDRTASLLGGGLLILYGLRRRNWTSLGLGAAGVALIRRGLRGHSRLYTSIGLSSRGGTLHADHAEVRPEQALCVRRTTTIAREPAELYAAWREFEGLPRFMEHLERVDVVSPTRSHWVARAPAGRKIEWDAEIVEDREGERIAWRTIQPTDLPHDGAIEFRPAPGGRGTEVEVTLEYEPPGGRFGRALAGALDDPPGGRFGRSLTELLGISPAQQVRHSLRRFKQIMEAGEVPTTKGQSSGRVSVRRHRPSFLTAAYHLTGRGLAARRPAAPGRRST
jgi:uncharacterized membrane protein